MLLLKTFILLGALQGFIVSVLLRSAGRQRAADRTSRRLLSTLIFLIALACLDLYLEESPWANQTTFGSIFVAVVPMIIVMPMGPLIYFYVRSMAEPGFRFERRYRRHFYPVIIDLFQHFVILCFLVVVLIGLRLGLFHRDMSPTMRAFGLFLDDYNQYADIPRWISLTIYLSLAHRYLKGAGSAATAWPQALLRVFWAFDILWLVFLIPYELPRIGDKLLDLVDWYPLYLPLVAIIYWLGIKGYLISNRPVVTPAPPEKKAGTPAPIAEEKIGPIVQALKKAMDTDKLWLDPELNLSKLARHCEIAPKLLSTVLNQYMDTTFSEFVNNYRVNAVRNRLLLPESRELTIAGVAYECGFNSLPTFQRAFKGVTGQSPKEYMASCYGVANS
jgi:AraC-like DNA-binding protein